MPLRRQILYYQLLKYSGHGTLCGDLLDKSVDRLCGAPHARLADVPLRVQLDALLQRSQCFRDRLVAEEAARSRDFDSKIKRLDTQEVGVLANPEVAQLCSEVRAAVDRTEDRGIAFILLGRALEAAGVAFAINLFTEKYRVYMESRLYRTQGLKQLLSTYGEQVFDDICSWLDAFAKTFVQRSRQLHAALKALMSLKRCQPEAYRVLAKRKRAPYDALACKLLRRKTVSLSLDDPELDDSELSAIAKFLPGRRAFSVDVQAGLEPLLATLI